MNGFTFVEENEGITCWKLDSNGLHVLLMPQKLAPVATFMITYKVGSRDERLGETGATHFLEHMMFKGTQAFNKANGNTVFKSLQRLGAQVNATTWNDRTNYYEMLPAEHLDTAIQIEADRMRGLLLADDDVRSEKTVILNEFDRGENEPLRKMYHAVWSAAFEAHPYHHPTIGWRSDIENMTSAGLRSFYDRYYWPNNAWVSVIGGFHTETVLASISKAFGAIPASPQPVPQLTIREPEQRGERRVTIRMKGDVPALMIAFKAPDSLAPESTALHLAAMVLSHGRTSRLYGALVDAGLATGQRASLSAFRDPGLFTVLAMLNASAGVEDVEKVIHKELKRMTSEPVSDTEFNRALTALEAETRYSRDGSFATAALLNEAIAAGDWKLFTGFLERAASQTPESIRLAMQSIVDPDRMTVGYFSPVAS